MPQKSMTENGSVSTCQSRPVRKHQKSPITDPQVAFKTLLERREGIKDCIPDPGLSAKAIL